MKVVVRLSFLVLPILPLSTVGCSAGNQDTAPNGGQSTALKADATEEETKAASASKTREQKEHLHDRRLQAQSLMLSDGKKTEVAHEALLNLRRCVLECDVSVDSKEPELVESTASAARVLMSKLVAAGFSVVESDRHHGDDCHLAFTLVGQASQCDVFDDHYVYLAELSGRAVNHIAQQVIATEAVRRKGRRLTSRAEAARDAFETAAADIAADLINDIVGERRVTTLSRVDVLVTDVERWDDVKNLCTSLSQCAGVYYVSLESWSAEARRARLQVLCRRSAIDQLMTYANRNQTGTVNVGVLLREAKEIEADSDVLD